MPEIAWPRKTRELHNHHMDSTVWNEFKFRDDDVIVATYAKSGTTWTQQIVGQILSGGDESVNVAELSPWVDMRIVPKQDMLAMLEAQTRRRFLKTHLPVDALVFSPKAKYVYIARDGRDVVWSMYNHHANANQAWYDLLNETPGLIGPRIERPVGDVRRYFHDWLAKDGFPFWPFWENIRTWWEVRDLPNVKLVHFANLKSDLDGEMRAIAAFLGVDIPESRWPSVVEHCTFDYMKSNAKSVAPLGGDLWNGGADTFIHKGTNGRWRDILTADDVALYEDRAISELGDACAVWLATGDKGRL